MKTPLERFTPNQKRAAGPRAQELKLPDGPLTRFLLLRFMREHLPHVVEDDSYSPPRPTNTFEYPPEMSPLQRLCFEYHAAVASLLEAQGNFKQAAEHIRLAKLRVAKFRKERRVHCG